MTPDPVPAGPPEGGPPAVTILEFKRIELRVATVVEARDHPNAEKLLILQVQVGDRRKQVVAGIKRFRDPPSLVGRQVIVVDNLEPAVLRGERSEGMVLAVLDGENFALLAPDAKVRDGARVT